jgi:hypothetical protein
MGQPATVNAGQQRFTFDVGQLASDPNTPPKALTYSLSGQPAGMSIDATTGLLTWNVPADEKIGAYSATVTVSNGTLEQSETLSFTLVDNSPPPAVTSPTVSTKKGLSITLTFSQPVDPATASKSANYVLTQTGKAKSKRKKPIPVPIPLSISFNPSTNQVTLKALKKPKAGTTVTLTVKNGIAKLSGLQLTPYSAIIKGKRAIPMAAVAARPAVTHALVQHGSVAAAVRLASSSATPHGPLSLRRAR